MLKHSATVYLTVFLIVLVVGVLPWLMVPLTLNQVVALWVFIIRNAIGTVVMLMLLIEMIRRLIGF